MMRRHDRIHGNLLTSLVRRLFRGEARVLDGETSTRCNVNPTPPTCG